MGAKHIYFVRSLKSDSKLSNLEVGEISFTSWRNVGGCEVSRVREDLEVVLRRHKLMGSSFQKLDVLSPRHSSWCFVDVIEIPGGSRDSQHLYILSTGCAYIYAS